MPNAKRRCRQCKNYELTEVGIITPLNAFFCSPSCLAAYGIAKAGKARKSQIRQRKRELQTKPELTKIAQRAFNAYIRWRDYGKPCISCGVLPQNKFGGSMDCGHYRSVGSAKQHRFNPLNAFIQCKRCNRDMSGNIVEYRKALVKRFGAAWVEALEYDNRLADYTHDDLRRIATVYNRKARYYKKLRNS